MDFKPVVEEVFNLLQVNMTFISKDIITLFASLIGVSVGMAGGPTEYLRIASRKGSWFQDVTREGEKEGRVPSGFGYILDDKLRALFPAEVPPEGQGVLGETLAGTGAGAGALNARAVPGGGNKRGAEDIAGAKKGTRGGWKDGFVAIGSPSEGPLGTLKMSRASAKDLGEKVSWKGTVGMGRGMKTNLLRCTYVCSTLRCTTGCFFATSTRRGEEPPTRSCPVATGARRRPTPPPSNPQLCLRHLL